MRVNRTCAKWHSIICLLMCPVLLSAFLSIGCRAVAALTKNGASTGTITGLSMRGSNSTLANNDPIQTLDAGDNESIDIYDGYEFRTHLRRAPVLPPVVITILLLVCIALSLTILDTIIHLIARHCLQFKTPAALTNTICCRC